MDIKVISQGGQANLPKVSQSEGLKPIQNKEVKIGVVQTNKATFDAWVISRAVFSAIK